MHAFTHVRIFCNILNT